LITAMDAPLGSAVGNALEIKECLAVLSGGKAGDLESLSVALAARMVFLAGRATSLADANLKIYDALQSGRGLQKFQEIIARQGGDPHVVDNPSLLPRAPQQMLVRADRSGHVIALDAEKVGRATMLLGAGRDKVDDAIDHAVGVVLEVKPGQQVRNGDPLAEVHYRGEERLSAAMELLRSAWTIADGPVQQPSLILETIRGK